MFSRSPFPAPLFDLVSIQYTAQPGAMQTSVDTVRPARLLVRRAHEAGEVLDRRRPSEAGGRKLNASAGSQDDSRLGAGAGLLPKLLPNFYRTG